MRLQTLLHIFLISFLLNFMWEHAHAFLYSNYQGGSITEFILFHASLGDAVVLCVLSLPFIHSPFFKKRAWLIVPLGLIVGASIEWYGLSTQRWEYAISMPLVPFLEVGLTPFIQLALTGFISYKFVLH